MLLLLCIPLTSSAGVLGDGDDDFLTCGTADILPEDNALTISVWLNITADTSADTIIEKRSNTTTGVEITLLSTEKVRFTVGGTTDLVKRADTAITAGSFVHLLITWDGVHTTHDSVSIYFDGVEQGYDSETNGGGSPGDNASDTIVMIGRANAANSGAGIWSEMAIWNVELSAVEIATLASSRVKRIPLQVHQDSLAAYWPLDECADGASCGLSGSEVTFKDLFSTNDCTGNDGAGNTGLTGEPEVILTYP